MIINFHTHENIQPLEGRSIRNIIVGQDDSAILNSDGWFSVGLHPWHFDESNFESRLAELRKLAASANVKLIGECGLDRLRGASLELQQKVFEAQINLAEELNKPVLIHCVKCYSELLSIKKRLNPTIHLIIHGFNNKPELGVQLLRAGFFFSLGTDILRPESNAAHLLQQMHINRLFLETDNKPNTIEEIYQAASTITKSNLNQLKDTIFANWMSLQNGSSL